MGTFPYPMEKRDLIKEQVEQLGKVLAKMLSDFLGLKTDIDVASTVKVTTERFEEKAGLDFESLLGASKEEVAAYLSDHNFPLEHLDILASYCTEAAEALSIKREDAAVQYAQLGHNILEHITHTSKTTSFHHIDLMDRLSKL